MQNCCFMFGHSEISEPIEKPLLSAIYHFYDNHCVRIFVVGARGAFDRTATRCIKIAKEQHPDIRLYLLLPYHPQVTKSILPEGFDGSIYPEGMEDVPPRFAIVRSNQKMILRSDALICYVRHLGNAKNLLEFAKRRKLKFLNVAELPLML